MTVVDQACIDALAASYRGDTFMQQAWQQAIVDVPPTQNATTNADEYDLEALQAVFSRRLTALRTTEAADHAQAIRDAEAAAAAAATAAATAAAAAAATAAAAPTTATAPVALRNTAGITDVGRQLMKGFSMSRAARVGKLGNGKAMAAMQNHIKSGLPPLQDGVAP
jgi:hypothetical protein